MNVQEMCEVSEDKKPAYNDGLLDGMEEFLREVKCYLNCLGVQAEESALRSILSKAYKNLEET